jgi:O-antigen/teichoic acid export membrane protein
MIERLDQLYRNYPRLKQVVSLFAVNILVIPLSIISNIFITRFLGPEAFGDFKFIYYVLSLGMVLFTFGFFQAGNRALVLNNDTGKSKEYYGSMLIILFGLFLIMALSLLIYAGVDTNIAQKGLRGMLIAIIPFSWVFLLTNYFEVLFQADNKISLLAKSRLYPKLIFFVLILVLYLFFLNYKGNRLAIIWTLFLVTSIIGYAYILFKVSPSFRNLKSRIGEIWFYNKTYGFNVYSGTVFNVALSALSGMLISYFGINNAGVGYYALALTIAEPLSFIPNVIATTHYKEFSTRKSIAKKLILITIGASGSALVLCWLLVGPFVRIFYTKEFLPVISLTIIVSFGVLLHGFADFFNRFLGSHGQGKALRNSAIIVGLVILVCNFTLIPRFGETGAAYTRVLSGLTYILSMLWFYRRLVTRLKIEDVTEKEEPV